jgi:hypothetical protein
MDEERARRIGKNEALFREVNERIGEIAVGNRTDFLCECADPACTQPISLTLEDYEQLRADSNLFGIVPGHEEPDVEAVVDRRDGYVVVKKREGTPADVARSTDPRS